MSVIGRLIRIARAVLEQVIAGIFKQLNIVEEQIQAPIQRFMQEVLGGMWRGRGADEFIRTISEEVLPVIAEILTLITGFNGNIRTAVTIMDEADQNCRNRVSALRNTIDSI